MPVLVPQFGADVDVHERHRNAVLSALSRPGAVLVTANGVLPGADVQGEDPSAPRIMVVHMLNANDEASLVRDAW